MSNENSGNSNGNENITSDGNSNGPGSGENSGGGGSEENGGDNGTPKSADGLPTLPTDIPGSGGPAGANPVPEPGTMLLFGLGLSGIAVARRRREDELDAPEESVA